MVQIVGEGRSGTTRLLDKLVVYQNQNGVSESRPDPHSTTTSMVGMLCKKGINFDHETASERRDITDHAIFSLLIK